jgi:hypothetical protein
MTVRRRLRRRPSTRISLRRALADPNLLGTVLEGDSWFAWRTLLISAMGESLTDDERVLFQQLTGRAHEPEKRVDDLVAVVGRRGGKSRGISVIATYISAFVPHPMLAPGERGVLLVIAPDQTQADITLDYVEANFRQSPILSQLIEARTQRELKLTNRIDISVRASDFRRLRGSTYVGIICDEAAFFYSDGSANPDTEILASVRPGLATTSGPTFIISSPYARRGELWNLYSRHYGPNGDPSILVAQAPSRTMNPSLPQSVVDRAMERDVASASAEYGAQFRSDLEAFVSLEAVRACVSVNILERPPEHKHSYVAFTDPSGGSQDSFTLCVAHHEASRQVTVIDAIREAKPPFSPEGVCEEFSKLLKTYGISTVNGDKYAGEWPREQFDKFGIRYEQAAKPKSDLYQDTLALLNSRRIELLDHPKLVQQLVSLERRTARSGRDTIDHPQVSGAHDDISNCVAGVASLLLSTSTYNLDAMSDSVPDDPVSSKEYRARRQYHDQLLATYGGPAAVVVVRP